MALSYYSMYVVVDVWLGLQTLAFVQLWLNYKIHQTLHGHFMWRPFVHSLSIMLMYPINIRGLYMHTSMNQMVNHFKGYWSYRIPIFSRHSRYRYACSSLHGYQSRGRYQLHVKSILPILSYRSFLTIFFVKFVNFFLFLTQFLAKFLEIRDCRSHT